MPTTDRDLYHEAIRTTLAQRAGDFSDADAIAKAASDTWNQMAAQLEPVIGTHGFEALFKRSLHLTGATFPWLAPPAKEMDDSASLPARVTMRLAESEPDTAAQASYSLLVTFTELLATMIGHSLTKRLLAPVWRAPSPLAGQETTV